MSSKWTSFNAPSMATSPKDQFSGPFKADIMILLTDGSVLVHNAGLDENNISPAREWRRLTPDLAKPDPYGQGRWSDTILMANARQFFASGVLMDGRVFAIGGEFSVNPSPPPNTIYDIPLGEIFDPQTNQWSPIDKPPGFDFIKGDAPGCVLADGRVLLGGAPDPEAPGQYNPSTWSRRTAIWSPVNPNLNKNNQSWMEAGLTASGAITKSDPCAEETWTLLPDGSVLSPAVMNTPKAERYVPSLDQWVPAALSPQNLAFLDLEGEHVNEIGPTILLPDGGTFAIGANGQTAIYKYPLSPSGPGTWTQGPGFPGHTNPWIPEIWPTLTACDAPACLLPSGKVVCLGGSAEGNGSVGPVFLEYDPNNAADTLPELDVQPASMSNPSNPIPLTPPLAASLATNQLWFLLLPTGELLCSQGSNTLLLYTPDPAGGLPLQSWKPANITVPPIMTGGNSYKLEGTRINGLSQAVSYGDDGQMATNYPIVKITNLANGTAQYLRSYNFSTMGVATGNTVQSCMIDLPSGLPGSIWSLVVIANGIPSDPVRFSSFPNGIPISLWGPVIESPAWLWLFEQWLLTGGWRVPPADPGAPLTQQLAAAMALAGAANRVSPQLRASVLKLALEQMTLASASIKQEIDEA